MMKKLLSLLLALCLFATVFTLTACGEKKKPVIGIIQFGSHGSLQNCYDGIMKGLTESGINLDDYEVEYVNSNFDATVSQTQARTLVNKKASVILAIATPSAIAAANAAEGDVPVVYCAVTDTSVMENYDNVTGSSDIPNFKSHLNTIKTFMKKTDLRIGVLYSTEESGSPFQIAELKKAAAADFPTIEIVDSVVADITTIDTKVNELIDRGVDCILNILDNTIVGKLESNILPITNERKIPVFGSEVEQVKVGCVASSSIDYIDVGMMAGKAAAEILGGKSADDIPVATITIPQAYCNHKALVELGLLAPGEAIDVSSLGFIDVSK